MVIKSGSRSNGRVPVGNAQPTGRRYSRRRLRTAIAWTLITAGVAILAGLALAYLM